jgi:hypothetical protein
LNMQDNTKGLEVLCEEWTPPKFAILARGQVYDGCEVDHDRELAAWITQVPLYDILDHCDLDAKCCDWGKVLEKMVTKELEMKDDASGVGVQPSVLAQKTEEARMMKRMAGGRLLITDVHLECHSDYTTALSSVSVSGNGRWMFEVTLESVTGNAKVGWASSNCRMSEADGVGDTPDSYCFDGTARWNGRSGAVYGQGWTAGDVIGVCIDLDAAEVSFLRNGCPLGLAFSGLRTVKPVWSMVYGLWSMVYGLWSMVYGLWSMVYGLWSSMVYGLWSMV